MYGQDKAVTFIVAYSPTRTRSTGNKDKLWTTLDRVVEELPKHGQLFVSMDANARTNSR